LKAKPAIPYTSVRRSIHNSIMLHVAPQKVDVVVSRAMLLQGTRK
jgi:hypothetical protein